MNDCNQSHGLRNELEGMWQGARPREMMSAPTMCPKVPYQSWNRWCEELLPVRLTSQQDGQIVISLRERRA
jgi:hypothetical protein